MTTRSNPRGMIPIVLDRFIDIEVIKKGIFPNNLKDLHEILNVPGFPDNFLAEQGDGEQTKKLLGCLQVEPVGPLVPEFLHEGGMPVGVVNPPQSL